MPYAVVETTDVLGNKELLAAPEGWIQRQPNGGKQYLCWPNVRNINTLNALLQDERSVPSLMWEKHECVVKRPNLLSLAMATKAIGGFQKPSGKGGSTKTVPSSPALNSRQKSQETLNKPVENDLVTRITNDLLRKKAEPGTPAHVPEMFAALKRLIDKNQEEMTKKMNEGFYRIQKTLVGLIQKRGSANERTVTTTSGKSPPEATSTSKNYFDFNMKPLHTVEEMNEFEARLKDEDYRKQVLGWIDSIVAYENNPEGRMMEILDLMFDRHLLPQFTWTGTSTKRGSRERFCDYQNIIALYTYTGTTPTHRADRSFVTQFFMKKLRHASARAATLKGLRRCVPHTPGTRGKRKTAGKSIGTAGESSTQAKIGRIEPKSTLKRETDDFNEEEDDSTQLDEYNLDSADLQDVIVEDHQYIYDNVELKPGDDMEPTLFMSAEDESE